jgi:hypothetical protein
MLTIKKIKIIFFFICLILSATVATAKAQYSDEQIRQIIIQQSISQYPGTCPCPYSIARNGSNCGGRSAYSKPGGRSPICYPTDISQEMVNQFRQRLK